VTAIAIAIAESSNARAAETTTADVRAPAPLPKPPSRASGWRDAGLPAIRGITLGPIENALHPGVGYGTPACGRALDRAVALGATWIALTPFGRMWSNRTAAVDLTFEAPFDDNRAAVGRAIDQAHARGLRVMLVPHLWLEAGGWRGELEPWAPPDLKKEDGSYLFRGRAAPTAIAEFARSYHRFALAWADVAEAHHVELFSAGVELRSWTTSGRANAELHKLLDDVRAHYRGLVTYSANWDDVDDVVVLRELDVIGINAFYPLAELPAAPVSTLRQGGARVAEKLRALAAAWNKPVMFTEVGYTTRPDPAVRPWEWPDTMKGVRVDEEAQADAYRGVLAGVLDEPSFAGFFVWRQFSDPDDVSQEAAWGFPVVGKQAELVVRDAFATRFAVEGWAPEWTVLGDAADGAPGVSWSYARIGRDFGRGPVAHGLLEPYPPGSW
jgi:hypothetical protein